MRSHTIPLLFGVLALSMLSACTTAMGNTQPSQPSVACTTSGISKATQVPAGVCDAFITALAGGGVQAVQSPQVPSSDIVLVVQEVSSSRMTARIDTRSTAGFTQGPLRAIARKGAPLDARAYSAFLTALIGATPGL